MNLTPPTLPASPIRPEAQSGSRFHGFPAPSASQEIKEEQPYHRYAAMLLANGVDPQEVAGTLEVTVHTIRTWLLQPWFEARVQQFMDKAGTSLMDLLKAETFSSLQTMIQIRDNPKASDAVRTDICKNILDRHLGKPQVRVEHTQGVQSSDPVAEYNRLMKANAQLEQANQEFRIPKPN